MLSALNRSAHSPLLSSSLYDSQESRDALAGRKRTSPTLLEPVAPTAHQSLPLGQSQLAMTCIILCGGKSKRMGRSKAFLPYKGTSLVENMMDRMQELFAEVLLVSNNSEDFEHLSPHVVRDIIPNRGPLVGILSGLLVAQHQHCFVMPCDMPLVSEENVRSIAAAKQQASAVLYSCQDLREPLLGVYSRELIDSIEEAIFNGRDGMADFLDTISIAEVNFPCTALRSSQLPNHFNIDTPSDYSRLCTY